MTKFEKTILSNFKYDAETGIVTRIRRKNRWGYYAVNEIAGTKNHGYIRCFVDGVSIGVHRLSFLFIKGKLPSKEFDVDHINGIRSDNRWCNLRLATRGQNNMNSISPFNNTSGYKGVHRSPRLRKDGSLRDRSWFARIKINTEIIHLGVFKTFDEAVLARKNAEQKYFGSFRRAS